MQASGQPLPKPSLRVERTISSLRDFPGRGRPGRIQGTRELVARNTPFVIAYRIGNDRVDILAIRHGARRWPRRFDDG